MSKWISVKDKLPENGDLLLLSDKEQITMGWYSRPIKEFIQCNTWVDLTKFVTHWQPLPEPPKD